MKKHNGIISFWKFMFCMMIVVFHAGEFYKDLEINFFSKGAIGVEFFFIVSGFLMAKSAVKKNNEDNNSESLGKETFGFIWRKIKAMFPYILVAFLFDLVLRTLMGDMTLKSYVMSIWDLFILRMTGMRSTGLIAQVWYISAMLICMSFLYPQIRKFKDTYFYYIAPLTVILVAGWLSRTCGNLRDPILWLGLTYKGVVRGYFEICLGSLLYFLVEKFKNINFTKFGKVCLTGIEIGGFVLVMLVSHFIDATRYDFVLVLILAISIFIAFSEKTLEFKLFSNKFFYYLEKLSLTIYLMHIPMRNFLTKADIAKNLEYPHVLFLLVFSSLILGWIALEIVDYLKKRDYYIPKIKKLFISE